MVKKIERFSFKNKDEIQQAVDVINKTKFKIADVNTKLFRRNPIAPFTTSTLQQTASGRFGFGASRTMQIAQRLYQGVDIEGETTGLITYMRTDGTNISKEAISDFRKFIEKDYGNKYLPESPNNFAGKKAKNAQEAHEAIRPTDVKRKPSDIKKYVNADQFKLYELIWSRALSSQMTPAEFDRNTIIISSADNKVNFRASGSVIKFDGFLKVYQVQETDEDTKNILPEVKVGEEINILKLNDEQHFTDPPPRYSEASLVKKMEELGIGRPSTYASIISVLSTRNYVELMNKRFHPTDRGKLISAFLEKLFSKYVDYNFTADLENQLDEITSGKIEWVEVLNNFWKDFYENVGKVKEKRTREVLDLLNESLGALIFERDEKDAIDRKCKLCSDGQLSLKNSFRGGAFIGCSNYPDCNFQHGLGKNDAIATQKQVIAIDPMTGNEITLQSGRYGPYLEVADPSVENEKPKRVSIPRNIKVEDLSDELALQLISLPKSIGNHPETNQEITGAIGRYGPYIKHENTYVSIKLEDLFSIGLNRAVTLIDEKNKMSPSNPNQILGQYPKTKNDIILSSGRYGPYLKYKKKNYSLGKNISVETLNLEEAIKIIDLKDKKN